MPSKNQLTLSKENYGARDRQESGEKNDISLQFCLTNGDLGFKLEKRHKILSLWPTSLCTFFHSERKDRKSDQRRNDNYSIRLHERKERMDRGNSRDLSKVAQYFP